MERHLKKYFWLLPWLVVCVCAVFAAKAAGYYVEGKYLGDAQRARAVKAARGTGKKSPNKSKSKSAAAIAVRNMFCSTCTPEPEPAAPVDPSGEPPKTALPLRLVATQISTIKSESFATILNTSTQRQGGYALGTKIPNAGEILRITGKSVYFRNQKNRNTERLALLTKKAPAPKPKKSARKKSRSKTRRKGRRAQILKMIDEGVTKIDDKTYEVDREVVDKVLENPAAVARGARIVPSIKNGKANGFKLYAIRPSSVYAKIGLRNGDTIHAINGYELSSPDKALEVYMKLREANSLSVDATRRGRPVSLSYTIK